MGHVAAILGDSLVVHGGRTSPDQALADVWAIRLPSSHSASMSWTRLDASDNRPSGRHRHSAVLVESSAEVSLKTLLVLWLSSGCFQDVCLIVICSSEVWIAIRVASANSKIAKAIHCASLRPIILSLEAGKGIVEACAG